MNFVNVCAALNPVLLIVILALMVVRKFNIKTFDYILLWLISFLNVVSNTLEVFFK